MQRSGRIGNSEQPLFGGTLAGARARMVTTEFAPEGPKFLPE